MATPNKDNLEFQVWLRNYQLLTQFAQFQGSRRLSPDDATAYRNALSGVIYEALDPSGPYYNTFVDATLT